MATIKDFKSRRTLYTGYDREKSGEEKGFVPADPRCAECYYWRYLGGLNDESCYCCHFLLYEGKMRERISETKCGSYKNRATHKKQDSKTQSVPMNQWGCGGLGYIRRGER